jgi:hypothetical protein
MAGVMPVVIVNCGPGTLLALDNADPVLLLLLS